MRTFWKWICFLMLPLATLAQSDERLHEKALVVDTHNDVLSSATMNGLNIEDDLSGKTHSDLARFRKGGVDVQVFSIFCDDRYGKGTAFAYALREIDSLYAIALRNPLTMAIVTNSKQLREVVSEKKFAAMLGVEGGHMIEDNLTYLDSFYRLGVRYMTLTWNNSTSWASSAKDESMHTVPNPKAGLNEFGRTVVRRMNALGMMVDLSHVGEQTFWDAIATSSKPILVSHSCVYALCPVFRNLKDDQIRAVGKNGGVIHVNFYPGFLDSNFAKKENLFLAAHKAEVDSFKAAAKPDYELQVYLSRKYPGEVQQLRPPMSLIIDHIDYIVKLIGVDHVGLGSDFDGIDIPPLGLDGVQDFPKITRMLRERGYSKKDIRKILGGNFLRLLESNESR
jgi:membrane dipeptidase